MKAIVAGRRGRCWDSDGRDYVDFACGYGPVVVGHADPEITAAVSAQLERGILLPGNSEEVEELESSIQRAYGAPFACHFVKTGSEAVAAAFRLARAFTGRPTIIRCGFHGWHDAVVNPYFEWHQFGTPFGKHEHDDVPGVQQVPNALLVWTGQSLSELTQLFEQSGDSIAALILDPVQVREPIRDNLDAIRAIVQYHNALLILDEAKTCFRVALNGVQGLYEVGADLTILSKALANGFPLACVTARPEIMAAKRATRLKGTYNLERVSIAAAAKTLEILSRPHSIPSLHAKGQSIIRGLNDVFERTAFVGSVRAVPYRWPCMPFIWFDPAIGERVATIRHDFFAQLEERGVLFLRDHMSFTCIGHDAEDIERLLQSAADIVTTSPHWRG